MPLRHPGSWRFRPPADGRYINSVIPEAAISDVIALIMRVATQGGDRQDGFEHFKGYFCTAAGASHSRSSSASWAETDLWRYAREAARNAPLFIEAFYDVCRVYPGDDPDTWAPDVEIINELLSRHGIGYVINPPRLEIREEARAAVPVPAPPPTLAERAVPILQESLNRSEDVLAQGRGREAVQESLWLLETAATAFRGLETATGTVEGRYFNQIVRDLRGTATGSTLNRVLDWVGALHGCLSSPTGGGVRHGLDLNEGVPIGAEEARLFCNFIRSYLSFLLVEHQRLSRR